MNEEFTPKKCGDSIDLGGIYVCRISVVPCEATRGRECAKIKYKRLTEELKNIILEAKHE